MERIVVYKRLYRDILNLAKIDINKNPIQPKKGMTKLEKYSKEKSAKKAILESDGIFKPPE